MKTQSKTFIDKMKDLNPVFGLLSVIGVVVIINLTNQANLNRRLETMQAENYRLLEALKVENHREHDAMQSRFDRIDKRLDRFDERFDQLFEALRLFEGRITRLEEQAGTDSQ